MKKGEVPKEGKLNIAVVSSGTEEHAKQDAIGLAKRWPGIIFYVLKVLHEKRWISGCREDILFTQSWATEGELDNAVSKYRGKPREDSKSKPSE